MTREKESIFLSLMTVASVAGLPLGTALSHIGSLVDLSSDLNKAEGFHRAVHLSQYLERQPLSLAQFTLLQYFKGNAWSGIRSIEARSQANTLWISEPLEEEILAYRKALQANGFETLPIERKFQILTNLGNALQTTGRFIEAIEYWDDALSENRNFPMATGNRGIGLFHYALALYDAGHRTYFLGESFHSICHALSLPLDHGPKKVFQSYKSWIEQNVPSKLLMQKGKKKRFPLGAVASEIEYKKWCLANRLFLNPLNDLGNDPIAGRDIFGLPSIVTGIRDGPYYYGFFNQMKQEFASARYLLYSGTHRDSPHFSDRGVHLYNTLDYPSYSLSVEEAKAAFRITYSLFDKIAYFLNHYLALGIPPSEVTFRTFWYTSENKKKGVREPFKKSTNRSLRALFWLSKDLFEDRTGFKDSIEPDAKELSVIRNHLEHKYLKLHDELWPGPSADRDTLISPFWDTLAYSIRRKDFENKSLRLMKMARAGLIYLSLAIHYEERKRRESAGSDAQLIQQHLDSWEDDWKV